jgi:hypothetical protein
LVANEPPAGKESGDKKGKQTNFNP